MYCPYCGAQLSANANFCSACGARLDGTAVAPAAAGEGIINSGGCSVMLLSLGNCAAALASNLLQQLCGYSEGDAGIMVQSPPIAVARNLTEGQANTLAQALSEYGMDVSVYDASGWREMVSKPTSVWSQAGTLIASAASALGLIGIGNRITRSLMRRWEYPYRFEGSRPPAYRLHDTLARRDPPPRPTQPRPVPRQAPRPQGPARPEVQPHAPGSNGPAAHPGRQGGPGSAAPKDSRGPQGGRRNDGPKGPGRKGR